MDKLLALGFMKAGQWVFSGNGISFNLTEISSLSNFLYAFVIDSEIMYIGKSTQTLCRRMYGYKNPGLTQKTNIRINDLIHDHLRNNKIIEIYLFHPNKKLYYLGFEVNLPAGLEDTLINFYQPKWNLIGKTSA
jgi:hypothetical protein